MKRYVNGKVVEFTAEEITARRKKIVMESLMNRSRPLTAEEVSRMLLTQQVNTLEVDDNTALRMREFYPAWTANVAYPVDHKVQYNGRLYKVIQSHTSQVTWEPTNTPSLWTEVCETHAGTLDDPIPYNGNMALTNGLYYTQDYEIYKCTRDTGNPVYNALSELVGLYVEVV